MRQHTGSTPEISGGRNYSPGFTIVIPFYNEAAYIGATLQSILEQDLKPSRILLIDNASTDESVSLIRVALAGAADIRTEIIQERRPGKIFALETASSLLDTEFVAFCDADTYYPPHYLQKAAEIFAQGRRSTVAAMAAGVTDDPDSKKGHFIRTKAAFVGKVLAKQCHTGGYGQVFRTAAFLEAGAYDHTRWGYVLEDHEIIQRILQIGDSKYDRDFWCQPSNRRSERSGVSWTTIEQVVYHLTPFILKDWFFYQFLANRFERRGLSNISLRAQPWVQPTKKSDVL
ncbi:MAG: glycosyltransferase family A protein [Parvularculaceae bacterium]